MRVTEKLMNALVSHPTGNANLRAVLRGLNRIDGLFEFWTSVALPPALSGVSWLPEHTRRKLGQRCFPEARWGQTHARPLRETSRLLAKMLKLRTLTQHETGWASVDNVYKVLDKAVARRLRGHAGGIEAVYAYEDGAVETFRAAKQTGRLCIYDLPIAHWRTLRRLLEEEADRLPDWAPTMEGLQDSSAKHERKNLEVTLADHVIVASSFTRDSLRAEFHDLPIHVTPYGCPSPTAAREPVRRAPGEPLHLLFAGQLTQRKGLADLISALDLLEVDWRLTLAGPLPAAVPRALGGLLRDERCDWLGVVPHGTLLERMAQAHVFVFPSIVEGFGMVITEALASGLPVITTPHTAGPDILDEGVDGFIVPIRTPEALAERITRLAGDETQRLAMAHSARDKARRMSWRHYEDQIGGLVTGWTRPK